jgi:hypothetical protein
MFPCAQRSRGLPTSVVLQSYDTRVGGFLEEKPAHHSPGSRLKWGTERQPPGSRAAPKPTSSKLRPGAENNGDGGCGLKRAGWAAYYGKLPHATKTVTSQPITVANPEAATALIVHHCLSYRINSRIPRRKHTGLANKLTTAAMGFVMPKPYFMATGR